MKLPTLLLAIVFSGTLLFPGQAESAKLFPSQQQMTVHPGDTVSVPILLDSQGEDINTVQLTVGYAPDMLEAVEVSRGGSFLVLWAEEPRINPVAGEITMIGGLPNGSIVYNAEVATVMFRAKRQGQTVVGVAPERSAVLLNDGFGTETDLAVDTVELRIVPLDPLAPVINSPTHPDASKWSAARDVRFTWRQVEQAFSSFLLTRDSTAEPDEIPETTDGDETYPALTDGIWEFALRERLPGEPWSAVVRRRVMIDGTPPREFRPALIHEEASEQTLVSFVAFDDMSGVDHYEIRFVKPRFSWFPFFPRGEWAAAQNPVTLPDDWRVSLVTVRAYDGAGNIREASFATPDLNDAQQKFFLWIGIFVSLLAAAVVLKKAIKR